MRLLRKYRLTVRVLWQIEGLVTDQDEQIATRRVSFYGQLVGWMFSIL